RYGVSHEKVEQAFTEAMARLQAEPVTDFELKKAINQVSAELTFAYGSVSGLARAIGHLEITVGYQEVGTYLDKIRQVTAADVQRVAKQYLTVDNRTVGWFIPQGERPGHSVQPPGSRGSVNRSVEPPLLSGTESETPAAGPPASAGGRVVRTILPNGLTLIAAENHVAKSVAIKGYVQAGPVSDPPGKAGLSNVTAMLLTRGTPTRSADALAESLDFLGASLSLQSEQETVGITAQMLTEHFDKVLDLLADCLRNPTFPQSELVKTLGQLKTRLTHEAEDSRERGQREIFAQLFPADHPLHRNPKGQLADLDNISRSDVAQFHQQLYQPDRTVLVIAGDLTPEQILASVQRAFGGWERQPG
ncbi:MAG TPA: insulinase family protein, partial [Candidatus Methylomirabilis sp.]|nr:insulinase family protein [Candidatus Methylomirabilis sp.]